MTFGESISTCFRKYADFSGRASRSEYWFFVLFTFFAAMAVVLPALAAEAEGFLILAGLFWLAVFVPSLAVLVRRLHDSGRSGATYFVVLLPFVGSIILLALLAYPGTPGPNRYGPNPLAAGAATAPSGVPPAATCPFCAEPIPPGAIACRWCGRDLSNPNVKPAGAWRQDGVASLLRTCPSCGKAVPRDALRCPYCRTPLGP